LLREKGDPRSVRLDLGGPQFSLLQHNGTNGGGQSGRRSSHLDVIFPVVHGPMCEDGTIQGMLELAGIPYVGAGVLGSAVGMDKDVMKRLLREAGIATPRFHTLRHYDYRRNAQTAMRVAESLGFPLFVKPANLGSSVGVSRVTSRSALPDALERAFAYDAKVLVEEAIVGREIECSVLGNDEPVASIPGEIVVTHADGYYSYEAKYLDDKGATLAIPAALDDQLTREVQRLSIAAFRTLECSGMARVDFFVTPARRVLVNEINTIPGFTAMSMYPKLWSASGVPPRELVSRLLDLALERHERRPLRDVTASRSEAISRRRSDITLPAARTLANPRAR
jgi:D-alanine-D-alanine ligase